MKRKITYTICFMFMLMAIVLVPQVSAAWGYTLTDGMLTIDGTGDMEDYASLESTPWHTEASSIKKLVIADGITSVGAFAFENCTSLECITIGKTVAKIGERAFAGCSGLKELYWNAEAVADFEKTTNVFADSATMNDGMHVVFGSGVNHIPAYLFYSQYPGPSPKTASITFADAVSSVGDFAFRGCAGLTNIAIGTEGTVGESYIGKSAFTSCKSLSDLTIGNRVTSIGFLAFGACDALTEVVLGDGITYIGEFAFQACRGLQKVDLGSGAMSIDTLAFSECTALTELTVGENVYYFTGEAFVGCYALEKVYWNAKNAELYYHDDFFQCGRDSGGFDVVFGDTVEHIPGYLFYSSNTEYLGIYVKSVTMGDSVTSIGEYAFADCFALESLTVGENVANVGEKAFYGCTALKELYWNSQKIGPFGFYGLPSLTTVVIGDKVPSIGNSAFGACDCLREVTIGKSVTSIGSMAFFDCPSLQSVAIGDSVTEIGDMAFTLCESLKEVTIGENLSKVGYDVFDGCYALEKIYWNAKKMDTPEYSCIFGNGGRNSDGIDVVFGDGVEHIPAYLFGVSPTGVAKIKSVTMGSNVKSIGISAFENCISLKSITIPEKVTSIGEKAFSGCTGLTALYWNAKSVADFGQTNTIFADCGTAGDGMKVVFGSGVMHIPACLFYPSSLPKTASITFTDAVSSVGAWAFAYCNGLTGIAIGTDTTVGDSYIGEWAFYECSSLTDVTFGNRLTQICHNAFACCTSLKEAVISDGVTSIGSGVFQQCASMQRAVIGNGVVSIGAAAFSPCIAMTELTVGENVAFIEGDTFGGNVALEKVYWNAKSVESKYGSHFFKAGTQSEGIHIVFGENVTHIPNQLFGEYTSEYTANIKSVTMGDNVVSVGAEAFKNCVALDTIVWSEKLTTIGEDSFSGCTALTKVSLPSTVTSIGARAFMDCSQMTAIELPPMLNTIEASLFEGCSSLTEIALPETIKSMGERAFMGAGKLTSLVIPNGVTSIGADAFAGCASLTDMMIPENVTSIGARIFAGCAALEEISVPFIGTSRDAADTAESVLGYFFGAEAMDGMVQVNSAYATSGYVTSYMPSSLKKVYITDATQIPYGAFDGCRKIEYVSLNEGVTTISRNAFADCAFLSLYMPKSVTRIGSNAFSETDIEMMYVSQDSFCHTYAINNGIPYTVYDAEPVAKITLSASEMTLSVGDTATLIATVMPEHTAIVWTTSACGVATIENGMLTAQGAGTAIITAAFADGTASASCTVTVQGPVVPPSNAPQIVLNQGTTAPNTTITIDVCIANNPGFISLNLQVDYDTTYLTLTDIKANPAVGAVFTKAPSFDKIPYNFAWNSSENVNFNGTLATLTFMVSAAAPNAEYPISVSYYTGPRGNYTDGVDVNFDAEYKPLGLFYVDGSVSVIGRTKGDVNGDNTINDQDITWMLRYLAGWNIPGIVVEALNVDGNAVINNRDATHLLRYLAGWDVVLQ